MTADHVTDERVTQLFNLADEIIKAPSRFTKDFVVMELGQAVAELAGSVERARADVRQLLDEHAEAVRLLGLNVDYDDGPCDIDHNGYCQGHNLSRPCTVAAAREFLAIVRPPAGCPCGCVPGQPCGCGLEDCECVDQFTSGCGVCDRPEGGDA